MKQTTGQKIFIATGIAFIVLAPFISYFLTCPIARFYCDTFAVDKIGCGIFYLPIIIVAVFSIPAIVGSLLILLSFKKINNY